MAELQASAGLSQSKVSRIVCPCLQLDVQLDCFFSVQKTHCGLANCFACFFLGEVESLSVPCVPGENTASS